MVVPFFKEFEPELAWWLAPLVMVVLVSSSNAVNLTDGLDGLAAGCVLVAAAAYAALTYLSGHAVFADYLDILNVPGASEVTIFAPPSSARRSASCGSTPPGAGLHGDVGSLALGARSPCRRS